jgi:uncharacterized membrane protein YgcG
MTTPTTLRITSTVSAVLLVPDVWVPPSPSSPLTVSFSHRYLNTDLILTSFPDAKQARDLVNVLREAKQQIDPRLAEMVRYGGGGGGGRGRGGRWGGGRGRGGGGGGWSGGNSAPLGNSRW